MTPNGMLTVATGRPVFTVQRKPGRHGEHWWHIIEHGQTIMSGFERSENDARDRAASLIRARGLPPVELA